MSAIESSTPNAWGISLSKVRKISCLSAVACSSMGPLLGSPGSALKAYEQGQFPVARQEYERLAKEHPDDPRYRFNAGDSAYRQKDWTNAAAWFESVLANPDLNLQEQANYNLGNTLFRLGESAADPQVKTKQWEQSIGHFEAATRLNPADTNAVNNLTFARQMLEELRRQQPPPQQGGKDDKKKQPPKDNKDKDSQDQAGNSSKSDDQKQSGKKPDPKDSGGDDSKSGESGQNQPKPEIAQNKQPGDQPNGSQQGQEPGKQPNGHPGDDGQSNEPQDAKSGQAAAQKPGEKKDADRAGTTGAKPGEPESEDNAKPGEMSAVQAQRLLDSQKGDEKALVFRSHGSGKEARDNSRNVRRPW